MRAITRSKSQPGFTLVELLVVIGIIAVLIALLMPALTKVRKHAQEVHCAANLRSIGQGLTMYTQQYGCYPGCSIFEVSGTYAVWPVRVRAFLGGDQEVFLCPARDERFAWPNVAPEPGRPGRAAEFHAQYGYELGEPLLNFQHRRFSYGYNNFGAVPGGLVNRGLGNQVNSLTGRPHPTHGKVWQEVRATRVKCPSQMIAITDSDGNGTYDFVIDALARLDGTPPGDVHRGAANVLFCDGHVQWHPLKDLVITRAELYPEDEPVRRMWHSDHMP